MNKITTTINMEDIKNHLKENGFIFQGSEIYGGLANSWDYGPLGTMVKNNIKKGWWNQFIKNNSYNVGLDSSIIMNSKVWLASGHLNNFSDPLVDCKDCKGRFRADDIIKNFKPEIECDGLSNLKMEEHLTNYKIPCPKCQSNNFTKIRQFQLMFETHQGVIKDDKNKIFLRPETAQGIFINFNNVMISCNKKIPFGIGQIGKSFRNEITPSNFIFRTREFEQMELEFFYFPTSQVNNLNCEDTNWFDYWLKQCQIFLDFMGISSKNITIKEHNKNELAHYAIKTVDIQYQFPFGSSELCGICNRGNFDLTQHGKFSGKNFAIVNSITKTKMVPSVIEPSIGVERLLLAIMCEAYSKETLANGKERFWLKLNKNVVPYHLAIIPLNKKKLGPKAATIFEMLKNTQLEIIYQEVSEIGKAYRYQDAIGTMYCLTVDFQTLDDNTVTIRDRDTTLQTRIKVILKLSNIFIKY